MAAIPLRMASFIVFSSALATLASQAYPVQAHQSNMMIKTPRRTVNQLMSWAMNAVTWVSAKTNTKSKNSSSGLTVACSVSGRILMRGACTRILWLCEHGGREWSSHRQPGRRATQPSGRRHC